MFALGIASLFFTAVSVAQQISAAGDAKDLAEEQKKQNQADRELSEIRNRKQKVEELRKGRIARAQILNSAEQTGASKSSGALGGASAVQSQTAGNIGFLNAVDDTSRKIFDSNNRISSISSNISQKQAFASVTGTLGATFSPGVKSLFKPQGRVAP